MATSTPLESCPLCSYRSGDTYSLLLHVETEHSEGDSPFVVREEAQEASPALVVEPSSTASGGDGGARGTTTTIATRTTHVPYPSHSSPGQTAVVTHPTTTRNLINTDDVGDEETYAYCPQPLCGEAILLSELEAHIEMHETEHTTLDFEEDRHQISRTLVQVSEPPFRSSPREGRTMGCMSSKTVGRHDDGNNGERSLSYSTDRPERNVPYSPDIWERKSPSTPARRERKAPSTPDSRRTRSISSTSSSAGGYSRVRSSASTNTEKHSRTHTRTSSRTSSRTLSRDDTPRSWRSFLLGRGELSSPTPSTVSSQSRRSQRSKDGKPQRLGVCLSSLDSTLLSSSLFFADDSTIHRKRSSARTLTKSRCPAGCASCWTKTDEDPCGTKSAAMDDWWKSSSPHRT